MLRRKLDDILDNWLHKRKTAILVKGARQVGKTTSLHQFAENHFQNIIEINFAMRTDLISSFAEIKNPETFLLRLSAYFGKQMVPHQTLIFFDEIQLLYERRAQLRTEGKLDPDCQDLLTVMKPLVIQGDYRYVLSGSLLGVELDNVVLNPTGYLDIERMFPLDFEEYLWAKGIGEEAIGYVRDCFEKKKRVDEGVHRAFLDAFHEYALIGGMPEAVSSFLENHNLYLVAQSQSQIIENYFQDISKYIDDKLRALRIREIYRAIPSELNSKNKRFMSSHVFKRNEIRNVNLIDEYLWLTGAGIALPTYNVNEPMLPLALSSDRKTMKLFLSDIGLLDTLLLSTGTREKLMLGSEEVNYGAPYENLVAEELSAHGYAESLYYYDSKKHGEVDFLIEYQSKVLPIEIKSGKTKSQRVYNHSALNQLIKIYGFNEAYVFGQSNVVKENEVIYQLPLYMIDFVRR